MAWRKSGRGVRSEWASKNLRVVIQKSSKNDTWRTSKFRSTGRGESTVMNRRYKTKTEALKAASLMRRGKPVPRKF